MTITKIYTPVQKNELMSQFYISTLSEKTAIPTFLNEDEWNPYLDKNNLDMVMNRLMDNNFNYFITNELCEITLNEDIIAIHSSVFEATFKAVLNYMEI